MFWSRRPLRLLRPYIRRTLSRSRRPRPGGRTSHRVSEYFDALHVQVATALASTEEFTLPLVDEPLHELCSKRGAAGLLDAATDVEIPTPEASEPHDTRSGPNAS